MAERESRLYGVACCRSQLFARGIAFLPGCSREPGLVADTRLQRQRQQASERAAMTSEVGVYPTRSQLNPSNGLLLRAALVSAAYFVGAEAAFLVGTLSDQIFAPFWPPNVILFCALVLVPYREWPLYILAVLPAHFIAEFSVGMGWQQLFVAFATNSMVALMSAAGVRGLMGPPPWLNTLQRAVSFVLVTAVFAPGIAALGGAFVRITGGGDLSNYWQYWTEW